MRFEFKYRGIPVLAGLLFTAATWAQPTPMVPEVGASDLPAYLKSNAKVLVLFTSPDSKCGFCVGADKGFTQAVQKLSSNNAGGDWRYITVQWQPWRDMPPQVQALGVSGVPSRGAFVQGKAVGWANGRETDIDHLTKGILAAQAGQKWSPLPAPPKPAAAPEKSPTKEEIDRLKDPQSWLQPMQPGWAEIQGRRTFLVALHKDCIARHPQSDAELRPALNAWGKKAWPAVMDIRQVGWLEREEGLKVVAEEEAKFSKTMQAQTGLAYPAPLDEQVCGRLLKAAVAVPLPAYQRAPKQP